MAWLWMAWCLTQAVALDVPFDATGGQVALRLLDAGYVLVPPTTEAAQTLSVTGDGPISVQARGRLTVRHQISSGRGVGRLEVLQRSALALEAVGHGAKTSTVTRVRFVADEVPYAFRARLALSVLAAGYGVGLEPANWWLCARRQGAGWGLAVVTPSEGCPSQFREVIVESEDELTVVDRVRTVLRARIERRPLMPREVLVSEHQGASESMWTTVLGASGGLIGRPGGVDGAYALALSAHHAEGSSVMFGLTVVPSAREEVRVFDVLIGLGPARRWTVGEGWAVQAAVRAGVNLSFFEVQGLESGTRLDLTADVPVGVYWTGWRPLSLGVEATLGLNSRGRSFFRGSERLWERGATRAILGVSLAFDGTREKK